MLEQLIVRYPVLEPVLPELETAGRILIETFARGGTLLVCGNGGSGADAEHIAGELLKSFVRKRRLPAAVQQQFEELYGVGGRALAEQLEEGLRCVSLLSHPAFGSAFLNDVAGELIFAQQLWVLGRPGDLVLGISTSGNARNILQAFRAARVRGIGRLLLTGATGGVLAGEADWLIRVPEQETYRVQELHLPVYHALCQLVESHFFPEDR